MLCIFNWFFSTKHSKPVISTWNSIINQAVNRSMPKSIWDNATDKLTAIEPLSDCTVKRSDTLWTMKIFSLKKIRSSEDVSFTRFNIMAAKKNKQSTIEVKLHD